MFVEKLTGRAGWGYRKGLFEIGYAKNLMVRWLIMMFPMKLPFKEDVPRFQIPSPKRCRTVFPGWDIDDALFPSFRGFKVLYLFWGCST